MGIAGRRFRRHANISESLKEATEKPMAGLTEPITGWTGMACPRHDDPEAGRVAWQLAVSI